MWKIAQPYLYLDIFFCTNDFWKFVKNLILFLECMCSGLCGDNIGGVMKPDEKRRCCKTDSSWSKIDFQGHKFVFVNL